MISPDAPTCSSPALGRDADADEEASEPPRREAPASRSAHLTVMRRVETGETGPCPQYPGAPQESRGQSGGSSYGRAPEAPAARAVAAVEQAPEPHGGPLAGLRMLVRKARMLGRSPELLLPAPGPHPFSIGRAAGSVLRLNDFTVSRAHAQLRSTRDGWVLRDLGSSNGTWVNGRRVTCSVTVAPGDHVQFGQVGFRLALP